MRGALILAIPAAIFISVGVARDEAAARECTVEKYVSDDMHRAGATLAYRLVGDRLKAFVSDKLNLPAELPSREIAVAQIWKVGPGGATIIVFDRHGCYLAEAIGDLDDLSSWFDGTPI
jgi:hypothetical protein